MDKPVSPGEASHSFAADWPGLYAGQMGGMGCTLELALDSQGRLCGRFESGDGRLEVYGVSAQGKTIQGFLREPGEIAATAIFRARLEGRGLLLEMDVPNPDEQDFAGAEQFWLLRLSN